MVFLLYNQRFPYHLLLSTMGSMKVHQYTRGFWEQEPFLTLGCKRLRPLAPKLPNTTQTPSAFDLKSFIRPECGPRKPLSSHDTSKKDPPSHQPHQVETHPGGTRWNPTQEQIGILEMLYKGGMRTPNAQQIEQITVQLGKYGKIEGKNVFYWFQNHKARERQKQKRNSLTFSHTPTPTTINSLFTLDTTSREEDSPYRKKCRRWVFECLEDQNECEEEQRHTTLELFPLHPEGR